MSELNNSEIKILNPQNIRTIVNRAVGADAEIIKYELVPYSKYVIGFLGSHFNLEVTVKHSGATEKLSFFVKSIPQESERQLSFVRQRRVFDQEAKFYNEVMPQLLQSYHGEPWAAKCFLATEDLLVLEDVRANGFVMRDVKLFDGEWLLSAARALARMHAASILTERRLGKSMKEVWPEACVEQIFNQNGKERGMFNLLIALVEKIARDRGLYHRGLNLALERVYDEVANSKGKNQVLSHADTWPNNCMFNRDNPPRCILLDFQMTRYSNRMWDIAHLIYFSTTRDIRMKEENNVIQAYHEELNDVICKHDSSLQLPNLTDTWEEFEEARLPALFAALIYYPFVLVKKEEYYKRNIGPQDIYDNYIFRINNDAIFNMMKHDQEYARRITETALELVERSEKLSPDKLNGI